MEAKELHLIILWNTALPISDQALDYIKNQTSLDIFKQFEIHWTDEKVAENFSRFYGVKLPSVNEKIKECGSGYFRVFVVFDTKPSYDYRLTSRGHEYVNTTLFDIKNLFREWTKGGHKVHTTNSVTETQHDISLLFGKNTNDFIKEYSDKVNDQEIIKINRDIVGAHGWQDLKELFYILNETVNYVILRNFDGLPHNFSDEIHGDIDILCDDFSKIMSVANSNLVFNETNRVHAKTKVGSEKIFFDFRYVGDEYYCKSWQVDILKTKEMHDGIFIPSKEQHFFSLVYHALVHKFKISPDYIETTKKLYQEMKLKVISKRLSFEHYADLLRQFMRDRNYYITKPIDNSVKFNTYFRDVENYIDQMKKDFGLKNVEKFMLENKFGGGYSFFIAYTDEDRKVFIKWGGVETSVIREFNISQELRKIDKEHFANVLFFKYEGDKKYAVIDWIDGQTLESYFENNQPSFETYRHFYKDLDQISKALSSAKIMHRDIKPNNLMVTNTGNLILFDFQFALLVETNKDFKYIRNKPKLICGLGDDFAKGRYSWDDQVSILKLMDYIGYSNESKEYFDEVYKSIQSRVGLITFEYRKTWFKKQRVGILHIAK